MFSGQMSHPEYAEHSGIMGWDLHRAHAHGDFGYSWELDGTVYHTDIAKAVIDEVKPTSPNILEANGGGLWSKMTKKSLMHCFAEAKINRPDCERCPDEFCQSDRRQTRKS
jgi:hypothetical protein